MSEVKVTTIRVTLESLESTPARSATRAEVEAGLAAALVALKFCFPAGEQRFEWVITDAEAVAR